MSFKCLENFYVEKEEGICVSPDTSTEYIRFIDFFFFFFDWGRALGVIYPKECK